MKWNIKKKIRETEKSKIITGTKFVFVHIIISIPYLFRFLCYRYQLTMYILCIQTMYCIVLINHLQDVNIFSHYFLQFLLIDLMTKYFIDLFCFYFYSIASFQFPFAIRLT